ncbi:MAG: hypothetical protein ABH829_00510 [archaeon]
MVETVQTAKLRGVGALKSKIESAVHSDKYNQRGRVELICGFAGDSLKALSNLSGDHCTFVQRQKRREEGWMLPCLISDAINCFGYHKDGKYEEFVGSSAAFVSRLSLLLERLFYEERTEHIRRRLRQRIRRVFEENEKRIENAVEVLAGDEKDESSASLLSIEKIEGREPILKSTTGAEARFIEQSIALVCTDLFYALPKLQRKLSDTYGIKLPNLRVVIRDERKAVGRSMLKDKPCRKVDNLLTDNDLFKNVDEFIAGERHAKESAALEKLEEDAIESVSKHLDNLVTVLFVQIIALAYHVWAEKIAEQLKDKGVAVSKEEIARRASLLVHLCCLEEMSIIIYLARDIKGNLVQARDALAKSQPTDPKGNVALLNDIIAQCDEIDSLTKILRRMRYDLNKGVVREAVMEFDEAAREHKKAMKELPSVAAELKAEVALIDEIAKIRAHKDRLKSKYTPK